jgi:hypothetical protein
LLLTILFTTEALKVSKGGIHGKAVMVSEGMTVNSFECAVTGMSQSLNDILVRDTGSMEGRRHVMAVVMQAAMRETVPFQKSGMA